jgi:DNA-binding transcriptional LysR family regulator
VFYRREFVPSVYDLIMGMFHRVGQMPNVVQEAGEQHTMIGLVAAGLGYTITPSGVRYWGTRDVAYRPLAHPDAWVSMGIAWRRAERAEVVAWFVQSARSTVSADAPK